jgi:hypothetical protein
MRSSSATPQQIWTLIAMFPSAAFGPRSKMYSRCELSPSLP